MDLFGFVFNGFVGVIFYFSAKDLIALKHLDGIKDAKILQFFWICYLHNRPLVTVHRNHVNLFYKLL